MESKGQGSQRRLKNIWTSPVSRLVLLLAVGKVVVFIAVYPFDPSPDLLQLMATKWDGNFYQIIATHGYGPSAPYVFSPVYPALIKLVNYAVGSVWVSAYLVTNALSFVFPVLLYKTFGYRTALLAELFPTYLLFTTIPYSDVVALVFLGCSILLLMKDRVLSASATVSAAILTFFNLAWTLPSFLVAVLETPRRPRNLLFYCLPLVTGALILLWLKLETGAYFDLVKLESPWGTKLVNPLTQAYYLLCSNSTGSYTCQPWAADGLRLTPPYWLVRNIYFETFYLAGALYLLKTSVKHRVFLCVYCLSVTLPLLFWTGFVALSIPRLLLPAFPVFLSYSTILKGRKLEITYIVVCIGLAGLFSVFQFLAYFSYVVRTEAQDPNVEPIASYYIGSGSVYSFGPRNLSARARIDSRYFLVASSPSGVISITVLGPGAKRKALRCLMNP